MSKTPMLLLVWVTWVLFVAAWLLVSFWAHHVYGDYNSFLGGAPIIVVFTLAMCFLHFVIRSAR
jgi:hypothetical protein